MPSCSNEDETNMGGYGKVASSVPPVANAGVQFPVTGVYGSGVNLAFVYDDGRMIGAWDRSYDNGKYEFTSKPLTIRYANTDGDDEWSTEYNNIKVNSEGFITSFDYIGVEAYEEDTYTVYAHGIIAYDNDGHIILMKGNASDG